MRYLFLLASFALLLPFSLSGQSTHKLVYTFSPEQRLAKGDLILIETNLVTDLPGLQHLDKIKVSHGTLDTITRDGKLNLKVSYLHQVILGQNDLTVELFYSIQQNDYYAKSTFPALYEHEASSIIVEACFGSESEVGIKQGALAAFRQNIKLLIDSMPKSVNLSLDRYETRDSISNKLIEKSLRLAAQEGLHATRVSGFLFRPKLYSSSWLLVNDPDLGIVTFDPYCVWLNQDYGTIEDLTGHYLIAENCFFEPFLAEWTAQVLRQKTGKNLVKKTVQGYDFIDATFRQVLEYYNTRSLGKAEKLINALVSVDPSASNHLSFSAMVNARNGEFEKARAKFDILLRNKYLDDYRKAALYYAFGNCLALQGKQRESLSYIKETYKLQPFFVPSALLKGDIDLVSLRDYDPFVQFVEELEKAEKSRK